MSEYILGQSRQELDRLVTQAEFFRPVTERMLRSAGVMPGMRVLDIGCGVGDVTFQVAEVVGERGHVIGLDRAEEPVEMARQRANASALKNVSFKLGTEADLAAEAPFDCIVGRYVLIYQPDPVSFVRSLTARLHSGGTLALHEVDCMRPTASIPPMPKIDRMFNDILTIVRETAAHPGAATRMAAIFAEAGVPAPSGFCERPIDMEGARSFWRWLTSGYALLQPKIYPGEEPVDIDGLAAELMSDAAAARGCACGPDQWCAWTVRP